jgi:hypothetical protein
LALFSHLSRDGGFATNYHHPNAETEKNVDRERNVGKRSEYEIQKKTFENAHYKEYEHK